ncbi:olfactory receptor 1030-like [Monodelphis domestica]|uniref:olfactory receptor 1030-like n=1 Tax=Monodelphis domestica TaxID=13616 RepID=UPI0024E25E19|nr:olfactory receptor 1030-like [Monodelphis domestica]
MESPSLTSVTEFILLGLSSRPELQVHLFLLFLMIYLMILLGNLLIVLLILRDSRLHTPMYFFLINLSILEVCYTSCVFPQMLVHFFAERKSISYSCCVIQVYTFLSFGIAECYILSVMAYDRYVAIRDPLRYTVIMNWGVCGRLAAASWLGGFMASTVDTVTTFQLSFCRDNVINHFLCEMPALLHLSCSDTNHAELIMQVLCIFTLLSPVTFIILSYTQIIIAVLRIRSSQGRRKAFSTCSSHLLIVTLFFGTVISLYMKPHSLSTPEYNKIVSVFYIAFTPTLNPLIYSLRNKDVKMALRRLLGKPEDA